MWLSLQQASLNRPDSQGARLVWRWVTECIVCGVRNMCIVCQVLTVMKLESNHSRYSENDQALIIF